METVSSLITNYLHKWSSQHYSSITLQYLNIKILFKGKWYNIPQYPPINLNLTENWSEHYYFNYFLLSSVKMEYLLPPLLAHKPPALASTFKSIILHWSFLLIFNVLYFYICIVNIIQHCYLSSDKESNWKTELTTKRPGTY